MYEPAQSAVTVSACTLVALALDMSFGVPALVAAAAAADARMAASPAMLVVPASASVAALPSQPAHCNYSTG